jgi:ABC-type multidrug transport system fused ATPase/permease subunit
MLTSFLMYTVYVGMSSMSLASFYGELSRGLGASTRVFQLLDRVPQVHPHEGIEPRDISGHIQFSDVEFAYPTRKHAPVLKSFSLNVPPDTVVAIVGRSGSGKSTLANLILRFYEPDKGKITLDGQPLNEIKPTWLRRKIGIVSQEPVLFAGTVAEKFCFLIFCCFSSKNLVFCMVYRQKKQKNLSKKATAKFLRL